MNIITIHTQAELDALPDSFSEYTEIHIKGGTVFNRIIVQKAWDSSHVVAWGSSHVEAWESSHVVARDSSHVVAWGSSHVEARDSSRVVAWGSASIHAKSQFSSLELFGFAVAILLAKSTVQRRSKTCSVIRPKQETGNKGWLNRHAISPVKGFVTLFKRVSSDWKTQENTKNETLWAIGSTVEHPSWEPNKEECGEGKFHACATPYFCDEFRSLKGDRYIAIEIAVKDLHAWDGGSYPHKIAFRKGVVLHECDRYGKKI